MFKFDDLLGEVCVANIGVSRQNNQTVIDRMIEYLVRNYE
jgi:hypothetical protein